MNQRALALDALRGYAIITMVLSATIISSILPGWMSHAQTPPPEHIFNPEIPGITCRFSFSIFPFCYGSCISFFHRQTCRKRKKQINAML